jgi:hypothetical protein
MPDYCVGVRSIEMSTSTPGLVASLIDHRSRYQSRDTKVARSQPSRLHYLKPQTSRPFPICSTAHTQQCPRSATQSLQAAEIDRASLPNGLRPRCRPCHPRHLFANVCCFLWKTANLQVQLPSYPIFSTSAHTQQKHSYRVLPPCHLDTRPALLP